ncbi:MAG TPA: aldo/keto reductase [Limnochordia bacterium]|nr:aldo/keto reductase [Limnochordia bacterium]
MKYRRLGSTGTRVSALCLGCWRFGAETDEQTALTILNAAIERGVNFIDTANVYSRGVSEQIVAKAIKGRRDRLVVATKVRGRMGDDVNDEGLSRVQILKACEASLRRLETDYIDLYQIHWVDESTPLEETLGALNTLVQQGKVRYIGVSNHPAWKICKALWISQREGWARFETVQPYYNLLDRGVEHEIMPLCEDQGLGIINYSPLAGGLLTGKYRPGEEVPGNTRGSRDEGFRRNLTDAKLQRVQKLAAFAGERGRSVTQLALAWLLTKRAVSAPIIGATSVEQLQHNLDELEWEMTADEAAQVEAIARG